MPSKGMNDKYVSSPARLQREAKRGKESQSKHGYLGLLELSQVRRCVTGSKNKDLRQKKRAYILSNLTFIHIWVYIVDRTKPPQLRNHAMQQHKRRQSVPLLSHVPDSASIS